MESQAVNIVSGLTNVLLLNIYIPPTTSSPSGYNANIEHLFTAHDSIIMDDFNVHHPLWHCTLEENQCGTNLAEQIYESNYGVQNENFPTRITPTVSSSPDITIASPSLLLCIEWATQFALSSDHIPILISIKRNVVRVNAAKRTYVNFSKTN